MRETNEKNKEKDDVIDLQELLMVYLRKWWLILVCGLLVAVAALVYTAGFVTPMYQASVSIYVNNVRNSQPMDNVSTGNLDASRRLVDTYINIAKSDRVMKKVSETLGGEYSVGELKKMFSASQVGETEIFEIIISSPDPSEAMRVANTMALVAPEEISNLIEGSSTRVIDYAKVPEAPYTPNYQKNILLGAVVGCVLALAYLTLAHLLDVRIKDSEDLSNRFDLPVLGQVPDFQAVGSGKKRHGYGYGVAARGKRGGDR